MPEFLGNYYGLDWLGMCGTFFAIYLIGEKKRHGFLFGVTGNIAWMAFGILAASTANVIANIIFMTLNIRGYLKWQHTTIKNEYVPKKMKTI